MEFPKSAEKLSVSKQDPNWKIISAPNSGHLYIEKWKENVNWIGFKSSRYNIPGDYTYETRFESPVISDSICQGSLSFDYAAVDHVKEIRLNGECMYSCFNKCKSDLSLQRKSINGSFKSSNILQFVIHSNGDDKGNPTPTGFSFQHDPILINYDSCQELSNTKRIKEFLSE